MLVDHDISPSQARNLEKATGVEVLDRTAVILEIFRRHARSRAAKAQVEIVRLQYLVPRLREQGKGKDRQRGGIGGKGAGESSLELDRRKIRDRIAELGRELEAMAEEQRTQRARRRDMSRVALVGYTNAGKSTLMRALTGSEVYVADRLFATLDTTVRPLVPATRPRVLLSDTVGFIDKLPHGLVSSFKSTLDEALEAGLVAQVVDASDPNFERQLEVTTEVLAEIGAGDVPRLLLFNKIDRLGSPEAEEATTRALLARWPEAVVLSARRPDDVARLHARLVSFFARDLVEGEVRVPYDRQQLRGEIFAACEVLRKLRRRRRHLPRPRPPRDARAAAGGVTHEARPNRAAAVVLAPCRGAFGPTLAVSRARYGPVRSTGASSRVLPNLPMSLRRPGE